ncbi:hypothetical protein LEP1GSC126_3319 [Leptospira kirschneri str. 200801774]|nr:hypothetical protein LEP1GSC126_3319 [Leptospira kirschneri str. 200801774]
MKQFYEFSLWNFSTTLLTKDDSERFVAKMKIHFEEFGYGFWK